MPRYSSPYATSFSFGPGPVSTAIKALIGANVVMFLAQKFVSSLTETLGLVPHEVIGRLRIWQLGTYMFLHGGLFHILFNMLALWMFGTELERVWGTRYFLKFYFVTGIGAAILTVLFSLPANNNPTKRLPLSSTAEPLSPPWLMGPASNWSVN